MVTLGQIKSRLLSAASKSIFNFKLMITLLYIQLRACSDLFKFAISILKSVLFKGQVSYQACLFATVEQAIKSPSWFES